MNILKLAWKNVWRNKLRSCVILIAITLGLFAGIFVAAFSNGMVNQLIEDAINIELTHLQINRTQFLDRGDLKDGFSSQKLEEEISNMPEVSGVSPRLVINATASTSHNMRGIRLIGIDPEKEMKISDLYKTISHESGNYFTDSIPNSVVIGQKFAEKFKVKLGSKVIISFADMNGEPFSAAFKVCGIFHTNNPSAEESKVYVRNSDLHQICDLPNDSIHELAIRLVDNSDETCLNAKNEVAKLLVGDQIVRTWKEINPIIGMYNSFMGPIFFIVIIIILAALGFGIINTVLMSVMERKRELSMLMAIGMTRRKVMLLIITESTILTFIGGLLGVFCGFITVLITSKTGIDMSNSLDSYSVIGVSSLIYPIIMTKQYVQIIIMVIITGILSALYPARSAIKTNPADGIRS